MTLKHSLVRAAVLSALCVAAHADPAAGPNDSAGGGAGGTGSDKLQTVVVTASPLSTDPDFMATIVDTVKRDEILRKGGQTLADALSDVPGVTGTSFALGASRPIIRGFDAQRVRTLEDGIGSFDVSDVGPDHGTPIDPLSAQQIEVVRGAATLRYGSQAIGGVVNAVNNRVPTDLGDKPISGDVTGGYGTNANALDGAAQVDARAGQFAFHADGFDRHTDNYDIPGGHQENSFYHGDGYSFGSSYFFGPQVNDEQSHIGAAVIHYDSTYGIPSDTTYIDMRQTKGLLRSSFVLDNPVLKTINVEGGYADYQHTENEPDGTIDSTFKDREWDSRAEALLGPMGPLSGAAVGVQAQQKNFSALGEDADYLFPTTTRSEAAFAFAEMPLSKRLRLQAGARVERVSVDGTPISDQAVSRDFTPLSASLGAVFDASDAVRLGLTATSAGRAPAQTELFARGPHDGPGTFETGDPTLKIERANSLEGTIRVHESNVRFEGSVWTARFDNYIYGRLTGRTCDEDDVCVQGDSGDLKELIYGQVNARFVGAEGKTTVGLVDDPRGKLDLLVIADTVRAKLDEGGNVPRIPPYHVGAGLNGSHASFDGGFMVRYTAAQRDVATAETPTGGFVSLDAQIGWHVLSKTPGFELALVGRNLTDSTQRNAVAINKDEVILPGRDVRLVANLSF